MTTTAATLDTSSPAATPAGTSAALPGSPSGPPATDAGGNVEGQPALGVLTALSSSHMVNDMMQSLILAMYPVLKGEFSLSFSQIGLISLTYQLTASLLQPLV